MEAHLNRIDGLDDAILTMFMSKRHMDRETELNIRRLVAENTATTVTSAIEANRPIGSLISLPDELNDYLRTLFKWGIQHITMLRFIDLSISVYGMHRGGQDDTDAHSYRMNNRVIRASTRLAKFETGEMSDYYKGKIVPTDVALASLGIETPDEIEYEGQTYVRSVNGYILKGHENNNDYRRGLYMLSIPSDFVYKVNLTEYSHMYKMRNINSTANPEVQLHIEQVTDQLETATMGFVTRELLKAIPN